MLLELTKGTQASQSHNLIQRTVCTGLGSTKISNVLLKHVMPASSFELSNHMHLSCWIYTCMPMTSPKCRCVLIWWWWIACPHWFLQQNPFMQINKCGQCNSPPGSSPFLSRPLQSRRFQISSMWTMVCNVQAYCSPCSAKSRVLPIIHSTHPTRKKLLQRIHS